MAKANEAVKEAPKVAKPGYLLMHKRNDAYQIRFGKRGRLLQFKDREWEGNLNKAELEYVSAVRDVVIRKLK